MQTDLKARRELAALIRHLVSGVITNDEFEDRLPRPLRDSEDAAVVALYEHAWCLYNDTFEHHLIGQWKVSKENRRVIARWILFLHSDLHYEWPAVRITGSVGLWNALRHLFTLGYSTRQAQARFEAAGDYDVWPFFRRADFENAASSPTLLRGKV